MYGIAAPSAISKVQKTDTLRKAAQAGQEAQRWPAGPLTQ